MNRKKLERMRAFIVGGGFALLIIAFDFFDILSKPEQRNLQRLIMSAILLCAVLIFDYVAKKRYPEIFKQIKNDQKDERALIIKGQASHLTLKILIGLGAITMIAAALNNEVDSLMYVSGAFIIGGLTYYLADQYYEARQ